MSYYSSDSPKARMLVAHLKRREAVRKASRLNEQTSIAQNQISTPDVQVASTVEPSPRAQTPQAEINGPSVPSPAPVNIPSPPENFAQDHEDEAADSLRGNPRDDYRDDFADVVSTGRKILAESNKENIAEDIEPQRTRTSKKGSLLDRQSVAHRISFEDSQRPSSNGQSSQNSEDEEFQQHNQTLDIAERRAMKPLAKHRSSELARSQRQSAKRARVHEPNCERNLQGSTNGVGEERENILPPSQKMTQYTNVNQLAKEKKVMMEPKRPQTRQPWSEEETGVLLDLIGEYGTSWKLLKDRDFLEDNVLEGRDQVALKDKARNMKLDYLKYVYRRII